MTASRHSRVVRLKGLAPDKRYRIEGEDMVLTGDSLMYAGICMPVMSGDFLGKLVHLVQE